MSAAAASRNFKLHPLAYYLCGTLSYGFIRSVSYNWNSTRRYHENSTGLYVLKEKLIIDKIGSVTGDTLAAVAVWPVMMGEDLVRLECVVRGKDSGEYGMDRK